MKIILVIGFALIQVHTQPIKCPQTFCLNTHLPKTRCIESNFEQPQDQTLRFGFCPGTKVCNFRPDSNYLWPLKPSEMATKKDISQSDLWGYCTESSSWEIGSLLPGRKCSFDHECYSNVCNVNVGKCQGLKFPDICRDSRDCEVGYRCALNQNQYSLLNGVKQCVEVLKQGDVCQSDDDCQVTLFCSRTSKKGIMQCQKAYTLNVGEAAFDGRQCKSGAISSKNQCALTSRIRFNKKNLTAPFACSPDRSIRCEKFDQQGNLIYYQGDLLIPNYQAEVDFCQCANYTT